MSTFYMLCGLPGSGKSYYAHEKAKSSDVIVSSDSIREEIYGDASVQDNPVRVFEIMFQRTRTALAAGHNVFYDATNISAKRRINLVKSLREFSPEVRYICIVIVTPIDACHEQNYKRERAVPAYVIDRMMRQFEMPCKNEGWDEILVHLSDYDIDYYRENYTNLVENYGEQGNSHHVFTLREHGVICKDNVKKHSSSNDVVWAAFFHDYGKVWTATRWEKDNYKELHYPNHANVGAYMVLTMGYNIHIAQLVGYHMLPYTDQRSQNTWRARLGEELWKEILMLHNADKNSH